MIIYLAILVIAILAIIFFSYFRISKVDRFYSLEITDFEKNLFHNSILKSRAEKNLKNKTAFVKIRYSN